MGSFSEGKCSLYNLERVADGPCQFIYKRTERMGLNRRISYERIFRGMD